MSRRRLLLAVLAALAACGGPDPPDSEGEVTSGPDALVLLGPGDSFRPGSSDVIRYMVFLTLVERDERGELIGRLARDWTFDPERDEWTVRLRSDVRWHDGIPVTARDVAFTLDLYAHPPDPTLRMVPPDAFELRVLDDTTYAVRALEGSDPEIPVGTPRDWYYPIYPAHLLEGLDRTEAERWAFWDHPVGNGPYRFVRRVTDRAVFLEANEDFYRGPPEIERITVLNAGSGIVELLAGNVDAAPIDDAELPKLASDDRFELYHTYNPYSVSAVLWNQARTPLNDPAVRRALTLAIDRREIFRLLGAPPDFEPLDGLFTARQFAREDLPVGLAHDPGATRSLLSEAGWRDANGDGIRERSGEPLSFTLLAPRSYGTWFPSHVKEAVAIQEHLRRVGTRVEVVELDGSVAFERLMTGDFDAFLGDVKPGLRPTFFGQENILGYRSPRFAELLDEAGRTFDAEALDALYERMSAVLREDLPVTLLMPMLRWTAARRELKGLSSPWGADPAWVSDRLWIEEVDR